MLSRSEGETWILERGTYWASEGSVDVGYHREKMRTGLWIGEGPLDLQTSVRGEGQVVLTTRGPIEEIEVEPDKEVVTEGSDVIARTGSVSLTVRRSTRNYLGRFTSG